MGNDTEILTKEFETVDIKAHGEVLKIGRISFVKLIKLMKFVAALFLKNADRFTKIDKSGANAYQDIMSIMTVLDETEMLQAVSIITDKPVEFCQELSFDEVSEIVRLTVEYNYDDISATLKKWQGTAGKLKAKQQ